MIYDRTQEDINIAKEIIETKVKNFLELTEDDLFFLRRGVVDVETINRIRSKIRTLTTMINRAGYSVKTNTSNQPINTDEPFFYLEDLREIVNDIISLRKAFFTFNITERNPEPLYHFEEFNIMERFLSEMENIVDIIQKSQKYTGTLASGQTRLPLAYTIF